MSFVTSIRSENIEHVLRKLLDRDVSVVRSEPRISLHEATLRGLVTDENDLVGVIGADMDFAHTSGAALAMVPPGYLEDLEGEEVDGELLEFYVEVANVLSRLLNEASPERVRIDPAIDHPPESLLSLVADASGVAALVDIDGYGTGTVSLWSRN